MIGTASEGREGVRKHFLASQHYLENALEMLTDQEAAKASELIWGSMAQALQAVAASRSMQLSSHRSLRWFASAVAKELDDRALVDGFGQAELLHSNFHEVDLTTEDVVTLLDPVRQAIAKLLSLIPEELVPEPPHESLP